MIVTINKYLVYLINNYDLFPQYILKTSSSCKLINEIMKCIIFKYLWLLKNLTHTTTHKLQFIFLNVQRAQQYLYNRRHNKYQRTSLDSNLHRSRDGFPSAKKNKLFGYGIIAVVFQTHKK